MQRCVIGGLAILTVTSSCAVCRDLSEAGSWRLKPTSMRPPQQPVCFRPVLAKRKSLLRAPSEIPGTASEQHPDPAEFPANAAPMASGTVSGRWEKGRLSPTSFARVFVFGPCVAEGVLYRTTVQLPG